MAIEEDANRVCLNISETECNRKRAQTWGFRKIANPAVNTSLYPIVRISDSGFWFCPLQEQGVEL